MKLKVFICDGCGAEIKKEQPKRCPLCNRTSFFETEKDYPYDENEYTKKYEEVVKQLDEYTEGTPPEDFRYSFAD